MKTLGAILKSVKYYFAVMVVVFIASILIGFNSEPLHEFLHSQIEGLAEVAGGLGDSNSSLFWFIFLNNAIKSVIFMYLGVLFGFLPFIFVIVNGLVIGYFVHLLVTVEGSGVALELIVRGLLPHGMIEIPIILLAAAYGLMLGVSILRKLFSINKPIRLEPAHLLKQSWVIVIFITVALFFAAFIEAYISTYLLRTLQ